MRLLLPHRGLPRLLPAIVLAVTLLGNSFPAFGQDALFLESEKLLPPLMEWSGKSEQLIVPGSDPWITPSERSGLTTTPSYEETFEWIAGLVAAAPELEMVSIGKSHQGRDIWMVIASAEGRFSPAVQSARPVVLAQAGIHAGEIDGKDAGMMLLRDMTVKGTRRDLLDKATFLFIPILNVDGHEIISDFNRINQRGPQRMGWRTNARNQNLNRDYAKLDTPGVRAVVGVIRDWAPDLYLDLHVTDGADYQYDITFGGNGSAGWSPAIRGWINGAYQAEMNRALDSQGHIPGPLVLAAGGPGLENGYYDWTADPRFSNAYGDARHVPTILVENHSLKPYRQRVLGTYVLLEASIRFVGSQAGELRKLMASDRQRRPDQVVLGFQPSVEEPEKMPFRGVAMEVYEGTVAGAPVPRWTGQADNSPVPVVRIDEPRVSVERPAAYLVPPQWSDVVERLAMHGIPVERLEQEAGISVELYHLPDAQIAPPAGWTPNPFEGRTRIDPGKPVIRRATVRFPAGTWRIATDHPLGELAALLLEPEASDSFFQWGFFLEIFSRTEYAEAYIMEPLAREMLKRDPGLEAAFRSRLEADPEFAADPQARLIWFYQQTPFFDPRYLVYPVARVSRQEPASAE